jgi:tRNA A37 methylthiotransferase MiaB
MKKQILSEEFRRMQKLAGIITEEQLKYDKGQILTLVTKNGDNNGEVTVDTVNNSIIMGYMKSNNTTPIKVKITQAETGEGYDVYTEDDTMIRNNHKIVPKN